MHLPSKQELANRLLELARLGKNKISDAASDVAALGKNKTSRRGKSKSHTPESSMPDEPTIEMPAGQSEPPSEPPTPEQLPVFPIAEQLPVIPDPPAVPQNEVLYTIDQTNTTFSFYCVGCASEHHFRTIAAATALEFFTWDGDKVKPTVDPMILVRDGATLGQICRLRINNGKISFASDCTHAFAGKTVNMTPWVGRPPGTGYIPKRIERS